MNLSGSRVYAHAVFCWVIRDFVPKIDQKVRPHGLCHGAISEAVRKLQAAGMDLTKHLQFSRHKDLKTLQVHIDLVEDVQGKIAEPIAK